MRFYIVDHPAQPRYAQSTAQHRRRSFISGIVPKQMDDGGLGQAFEEKPSIRSTSFKFALPDRKDVLDVWIDDTYSRAQDRARPAESFQPHAINDVLIDGKDQEFGRPLPALIEGVAARIDMGHAPFDPGRSFPVAARRTPFKIHRRSEMDSYTELRAADGTTIFVFSQRTAHDMDAVMGKACERHKPG